MRHADEEIGRRSGKIKGNIRIEKERERKVASKGAGITT